MANRAWRYGKLGRFRPGGGAAPRPVRADRQQMATVRAMCVPAGFRPTLDVLRSDLDTVARLDPQVLATAVFGASRRLSGTSGLRLREWIWAGVWPGLQNQWGRPARRSRWVRFPCTPAISRRRPAALRRMRSKSKSGCRNKLESHPARANLFPLKPGDPRLSDLILPVLGMAVPVLAVVSIALLSGRRLSGSCGGMSLDGTCSRCGKSAAEIPKLQANRDCP